MARPRSAGLLVYRRRGGAVEFLLAHPGGPFWRNRDVGVWTIPKGLIEAGEADLAAAVREFEQEVGHRVDGAFTALQPCRLKSGKQIFAWLAEADLDLSSFRSNTFHVAWPRGAEPASFPEIDRVGYFPPAEALAKIHAAQRPLIEEATRMLAA